MSRETSAAAQARLSVGDSRSGAEGLDARCLLVISQVAATGSLSAAAEQLGCSPSTVHQQLAGLQERAGVRLYRRSRGGVVMTSCGAELAAHGQRIHKIVALAADRIERVALAERRILSVVAFRAHPMINVIYYQLARGAAGLRVELDALSAGEAIDRVRGGRSEALFGYGLGGIDADERADDLNATTIVEVPMRVVLHQEHPCANADAVALVDLHEEPWVVADGGTVLHAHTRAACQAVGFEPDIRFAVDRDSVTRLVALRAGVALVCATTSTGALPVTLVPLVDELRLAGYLAWRHDSPHRAALTDLARSLAIPYHSWLNRMAGPPAGTWTPAPDPSEPTCTE